MEGSEFSEGMQKLVRDNGDGVAISSAECVVWKMEHPNCGGCQYELGCGKTVHLMGLMLIPRMYEPKDYTDYQTMNNRIQELMTKTLKAKTLEELRSVPFQ